MQHEHYMQRALELAARGTGCTSPNPLVGCVVVRDEQIIGEGWHALYGHSHAEVNALNAAGDARGATLYVTLEPCHHHGLTPPCTQAVLQAGIEHVIYALADPNPRAAGGADWLETQGIRVSTGILENEARYQNRFFLKHVACQRPYVIAKSATSLDGRIATRTGHSQWITGPEARQRGHQLRQAVDAVIVGANTVIADDPSLTVRLTDNANATGPTRHPRPVVLDSTGRIPLTTKLLNGSLPTRTLIITTDRMTKSHRQELEMHGFEVVTVLHNEHGPGTSPLAVLQALGDRGIHSVLIEGGATVNGAFRDAGLIDEVWTFIAPTLIGGESSKPAYTAIGSDTLSEATQLHDVHVETVGRDVLVRGCVAPPDNTDTARDEHATDSCASTIPSTSSKQMSLTDTAEKPLSTQRAE